MKYKTVSPGITRFEVEGSTVRGYLVRMRRNGKKLSEFYSDAQYGGKRKSLIAAKEAYARMLEMMGPIVSATRDRVTKRNTSGHVGVHVAHSADSRYPNSQSWSYCASWVSDEGVRSKISFSWTKYGQDLAWELACFARQKMISDRAQVVALYETQQKRSGGKVNASDGSTKTSVKKSPATKAVSTKTAGKKVAVASTPRKSSSASSRAKVKVTKKAKAK